MPPRVTAFFIHLSASAILALLAVALVFFVWYPTPLYLAVGVTTVFFVVLGVDVVIGPVLTLIVFKRDKKGLRFDLATIVTLQLMAFAYGLWTVAEGRPAWLVFNVDRFDLVQAYEIDYRHPEEIALEFRQPSWIGPGWASARAPSNPAARNALTFESVFAGVDLPQRADLYRPLSAEAPAIRAKAFPLERLLRFNSAAQVQAVRERWPSADAWLPMMSKSRPVTVLLRRETAKVLAVVNLKPWD